MRFGSGCKAQELTCNLPVGSGWSMKNLPGEGQVCVPGVSSGKVFSRLRLETVFSGQGWKLIRHNQRLFHSPQNFS